MNRVVTLALLLAAAFPTAAHHSFAIYDMQQDVEFHGVIASVKLRNPHMAMTLTTKDASGKEQTVNFVEGAPANMLARLGLRPEHIKVGTQITAIGAPRHDDPVIRPDKQGSRPKAAPSVQVGLPAGALRLPALLPTLPARLLQKLLVLLLAHALAALLDQGSHGGWAR